MKLLRLTLVLALVGCATGQPGLFRKRPTVSDEAKGYAHYLTAFVYERAGRTEDAIEEYQKASEKDPDSLIILVRLIQACLRAEDLDCALAANLRATEMAPEQVVLWLTLGSIYRQLDQYDASAAAFRKALELDPENSSTYEALALLEEGTNDLMGAIDIYEQLLELHPNNAQLYYQLGLAWARTKNHEAARDAFAKAVELSPKYVQARFSLAVFCMEVNAPAQALTNLSILAGQIPQYEQAMYKLLSGAQNDEQRQAIQRSFALSGPPPATVVRQYQAGAMARLGRVNGALELLMPAIESGEAEVEERLLAALLQIYLGHPEAVEPLQCDRDAPISGSILNALARNALDDAWRPAPEQLNFSEEEFANEWPATVDRYRFVLGDEGLAFLADRLERLRRIAEGNRAVDEALTSVYIGLEDYAAAYDILRNLVEHYGPTRDWLYDLATMAEFLDRPADVEFYLLRCLDLNPEDADAMNFLGYTYAEEDMKLREGKRLIEKALELEPGNGYYLDSLGWVYYRQGKAQRAIELIRQAILAMPEDDAVLRDHLGDAYWLDGQEHKAIGQWRRATRLDPGLEGVAEKLKAAEKE